MFIGVTPFFDPNKLPKTDEEKKAEHDRQVKQSEIETKLVFGNDLGGAINSITANAAKSFALTPVAKDIGEGFISAGKFLDNATAKVLGIVVPDSDLSVASQSSQSGVSAKPIVYSDWSPASRLFGMSQQTAFSEHLANTAHQREVADLKAAGLNPVLGISGSGASNVSGNAAVGSSSAQKANDFPFLDVLGATAGLITTLVSKKPALGYMVANVFKAFD